MKNLYTCIVLALVVLVTGCSSFAPLRPADSSGFQTGAMNMPPAAGPALMGHPGAAAHMGYPQSYAWLDKRVPGCETGPLALRITNETSYFVKVMIDGVELQVFGGQGPLPGFIPPGSAAWVCLAKNGEVNLAGIAYVKRPNGPTGTYSLQEVDGDLGRFNMNWNLGPATDAVLQHHQFRIDTNTFFFN